MRAMQLQKYSNISKDPLEFADVEEPVPDDNEILVKVSACGVCRTDLHIIEGELPEKRLPITPGHEVIGKVREVGSKVRGLRVGDRVGVTWVNSTCGICEFCISGRENLCKDIRCTGYDVNGGYAEYLTVSAKSAFRIPKGFGDVNAAPLMCAGVIGFHALKLSGLKPGDSLSLFGFGGSGHIIAQIAKYWRCDTFVFTRGESHRRIAESIGVSWTGGLDEEPEEAKADAAIITAPDGNLVINALHSVKRGGKVIIADIFMSDIPLISYYRDLYLEKSVGSATNYTREDVKELLGLASKIPIKTMVERYPLQDANEALANLKERKVNGAAVLVI